MPALVGLVDLRALDDDGVGGEVHAPRQRGCAHEDSDGSLREESLRQAPVGAWHPGVVDAEPLREELFRLGASGVLGDGAEHLITPARVALAGGVEQQEHPAQHAVLAVGRAPALGAVEALEQQEVGHELARHAGGDVHLEAVHSVAVRAAALHGIASKKRPSQASFREIPRDPPPSLLISQGILLPPLLISQGILPPPFF